MGQLARIMQYGLCHEEVSRKGEWQPCEKTAVAVRIDPTDEGPYPVCAYHARGKMVSLPHLLADVADAYSCVPAEQNPNADYRRIAP